MTERRPREKFTLMDLSNKNNDLSTMFNKISPKKKTKAECLQMSARMQSKFLDRNVIFQPSIDTTNMLKDDMKS